jgi:hypothetical protein
MNWRKIATAPKDQHILLCYQSFSDPGETIVQQGRWVDVPHINLVHQALSKFENPSYTKPDAHWEIAYVAILQHGGKWDGHSYEIRGARVNPTHWMPLPKPKK